MSYFERDSRTLTRGSFPAFILAQALFAASEEPTLSFNTMGYEPDWRYDGGSQFLMSGAAQGPGRLAGFQFVRHAPDAIRFTALDDGLFAPRIDMSINSDNLIS